MALLFRSAAALLESGQSVALESDFYSEWDTPPLRQLAEKFWMPICAGGVHRQRADARRTRQAADRYGRATSGSHRVSTARGDTVAPVEWAVGCTRPGGSGNPCRHRTA